MHLRIFSLELKCQFADLQEGKCEAIKILGRGGSPPSFLPSMRSKASPGKEEKNSFGSQGVQKFTPALQGPPASGRLAGQGSGGCGGVWSSGG